MLGRDSKKNFGFPPNSALGNKIGRSSFVIGENFVNDVTVFAGAMSAPWKWTTKVCARSSAVIFWLATSILFSSKNGS